MNGFLISNIETPTYIEKYKGEFNEIRYKEFIVRVKPDSKFKEDKAFYENQDYIIVLQGIILNFKELMQTYSCNSMCELCVKMIEQEGEQFHKNFIGNFAGAICYKECDKWVVFSNKLSSKQLFFYCQNGVFMASTLITDIADTLRQNNIKYTFNNDAAYLMLTYGYMGTDDTFVNQIKKIEAGHQILFQNGKYEDICYHRFTNNKYDLKNASEDEIIAGIDKRFRRAIKREYDKDNECGYEYHLRTLTGGTDSRAAAFVSHSLGYLNAVNMTYGVPEHPDEKIARQISKHFENNLIYISNSPMKNEANFILNIDNAVYKSQGQTYYFEVAQATKKKIELDRDTFGLTHGGAFSEAFLTTGYLKEPSMQPPTKPLHVYCSLMIDKCPKEHLKKYENEDIYSIYSIFLNKHNPSGRNLVEIDDNYVFPGLDTDLVEYCLSIPIELRMHYYIYHKWLFNKYPEAKKFKLEKLNAKVNDCKLKKWWGKIHRYGNISQYFRCSKEKFPSMVRKTFNLDKRIKPSNIALMPFDYWYDSSKEAQEYMLNYFEKNMKNPVINEELRNDLKYVYENGLARPKSMVITVTAAAKMLFPEKEKGEK